MQIQMLYFKATLSMEIIMNNYVISKYPSEHKAICALC